MILYIGMLLTVFFILFALFSPSYKYPLIAFILIRPVIDASWSYRFGEMSLIHIFNSAFIIIYLIKLLLKKERICAFPYFNLFLIYFHVLVFVAIHIYINSGFMTALDFFLKSLFMPLSFYLFYNYFSDYKSGKTLIMAIMLSGLFPLFFTLFQKFSGHVWFYRDTRGLMRSVGLYHDAVITRFFFMQILVGLFIYWHYFLKKKHKNERVVLTFLFVVSCLGLYFLYSKTIIVTAILWVLLFSFMRRKIYVLAFALVLVFIINIVTGNLIYSEMNQVFLREKDFIRGELDSDQVLSGRGRLWKRYLSNWPELPFTHKVIGSGIHTRIFHNDYFRALFSGGILLLSSYIILAITLFWNVICDFIKNGRFISFVAILCGVYLFVESLGQVAGLYPDLQTVIWGVVGLSLNSRFEWTSDSAKNEQYRNSYQYHKYSKLYQF